MFKKVLLTASLLGATCLAQAAPIIDEGFNSVAGLSGSGWTLTNNSTAGGSTGWFQGDECDFGSPCPSSKTFISANYLNAPYPSGGNVSNWLITPTFNLGDSLFLSFETRSNGFLPDRLEVRMSVNGASGDVGASDASVGDFSTLLLVLNPALADGGYPSTWTTYKIWLPSAGGALGRLAFRYNVTDTTVNGDLIGIDSVSVSVPEPSTLALFSVALFAVGCAMARRRPVARTV